MHGPTLAKRDFSVKVMRHIEEIKLWKSLERTSVIVCWSAVFLDDECNRDVTPFKVAAVYRAVLEYSGMSIQPEELPLHLSRIQTCQGGWLIAIQSVAEARIGSTLLLKLILEQSMDDEHFRTRELGMQVPAVRLYDPDLFADVISQIRQWIETTEGDGFLELSEFGQ